MTDDDRATVDFDQVVAVLERRARLVVARWAELGTNHLRITGGGRIADGELRDRFTRLRGSVEQLAIRIGRELAGTPSVATIFKQVCEALAFKTFSTLPEPQVEARLEDAWAALLDAMAKVDACLAREAAPLGECLPQLTPDEFDGLAEAEAEDGRDPDPLRRIARMAALRDDIALMASEARGILSGRFHRIGGRGAPEKIRGRRLAAHLLGAAEGLGLRPSRNREPTGGRPGRSAADAVLAALRQCSDVTDPMAKAILAECPKEYMAMEKLLPACNEGSKGNALLIREHQDGKLRVAHWA